MKKKIVISCIIIVTLIIVGINFYITKEKEEIFQKNSFVVEEVKNPNSSIVFSPKEMEQMKWEDIDVNYQRKVGPAEVKQYKGISLANILKEAEVSEKDIDKVQILGRDQYQIELSAKEAFQNNHAYLVAYEKEEPLKKEEGSYMLILCQDQFSTRWVKQVVNIAWTSADTDEQ